MKYNGDWYWYISSDNKHRRTWLMFPAPEGYSKDEIHPKGYCQLSGFLYEEVYDDGREHSIATDYALRDEINNLIKQSYEIW